VCGSAGSRSGLCCKAAAAPAAAAHAASRAVTGSAVPDAFAPGWAGFGGGCGPTAESAASRATNTAAGSSSRSAAGAPAPELQARARLSQRDAPAAFGGGSASCGSLALEAGARSAAAARRGLWLLPGGAGSAGGCAGSPGAPACGGSSARAPASAPAAAPAAGTSRGIPGLAETAGRPSVAAGAAGAQRSGAAAPPAALAARPGGTAPTAAAQPPAQPTQMYKACRHGHAARFGLLITTLTHCLLHLWEQARLRSPGQIQTVYCRQPAVHCSRAPVRSASARQATRTASVRLGSSSRSQPGRAHVGHCEAVTPGPSSDSATHCLRAVAGASRFLTPASGSGPERAPPW